MAQTQQPSGAYAAEPEVTGWVGWVWFAGTMMIIAGGLNMFYGIVALVNDTWVGWSSTGRALVIDLTGWGWVHVIVGRHRPARAASACSRATSWPASWASSAAAISIFANFLFIPAYPLWTLTVITIDVLVIWAILAHGGELRTR